MNYKYQGYLSLWKIETKYHGDIHVNAFTEEESIQKTKEWIKDTPMYQKLGESCFDGLKATKDESYPFVLI